MHLFYFYIYSSFTSGMAGFVEFVRFVGVVVFVGVELWVDSMKLSDRDSTTVVIERYIAVCILIIYIN